MFVPTRILAKAAAILIVIAGWGLGQCKAQSVALTFYTNTAPYAALGSPIGYFLAITNTGSATIHVTGTITLTAPDASTYQVFLSQPLIAAGASAQASGTFLSTTYTSQTGSFNLTATVTNKGGTTLASQT